MGENTYTVSASTKDISDTNKTITKTADVTFNKETFEETIYVGNYSTFITKIIASVTTVIKGLFANSGTSITDAQIKSLIIESGVITNPESEFGSLYEQGLNTYTKLISKVTDEEQTEINKKLEDAAIDFVSTDVVQNEINNIVQSYLNPKNFNNVLATTSIPKNISIHHIDTLSYLENGKERFRISVSLEILIIYK